MFGNVIYSFIAFVIALGILISIHEFGHFWVARRVGVKVLKFSIGFGKPLWSRRGKVDDTEYVIAAIPLGGYVKMLDEREGSVDQADADRAFNRKNVWQRIAVVIAGPMANFILAILLYWLVMMIGISGVSPLLGDITPGSAADKAGFKFEDRIVSIEDTRTPTWNDARIALLKHALSGNSSGASGEAAPKLLQFEVETASGDSIVRELEVDGRGILKGDGDVVAKLGIQQWWPRVPAVIGRVVEGGAAEAAGLLVGDKIISANGQLMETWRDWVMAVRAHPQQLMQLELQRGDDMIAMDLTPAKRDAGDGQIIGYIGAAETLSMEEAQKARVTVSYPPLESLKRGFQRTWEMSALTLKMLQKLLIGQASLENISGPISIAQFAGQSASIGIDHYLNFIALISISLAVLNLLPIPMLDGGHLMYYAFEVVFRRPVPERVQEIGQSLGILILGSLMALAFYNDIWRLAQ